MKKASDRRKCSAPADRHRGRAAPKGCEMLTRSTADEWRSILGDTRGAGVAVQHGAYGGCKRLSAIGLVEKPRIGGAVRSLDELLGSVSKCKARNHPGNEHPSMSVGPTQAVIVCRHAAENPKRLVRGERSEPLEPADSGWAFYCQGGDHTDETGAQVWSVSELLGFEPSLADLLNLPTGSKVQKDNLGHWLTR